MGVPPGEGKAGGLDQREGVEKGPQPGAEEREPAPEAEGGPVDLEPHAAGDLVCRGGGQPPHRPAGADVVHEGRAAGDHGHSYPDQRQAAQPRRPAQACGRQQQLHQGPSRAGQEPRSGAGEREAGEQRAPDQGRRRDPGDPDLQARRPRRPPERPPSPGEGDGEGDLQVLGEVVRVDERAPQAARGMHDHPEEIRPPGEPSRAAVEKLDEGRCQDGPGHDPPTRPRAPYQSRGHEGERQRGELPGDSPADLGSEAESCRPGSLSPRPGTRLRARALQGRRRLRPEPEVLRREGPDQAGRPAQALPPTQERQEEKRRRRDGDLADPLQVRGEEDHHGERRGEAGLQDRRRRRRDAAEPPRSHEDEERSRSRHDQLAMPYHALTGRHLGPLG